MNKKNGDDLQVVALKNTKQDVRNFVRFAEKIYDPDPLYAPPLIRDLTRHLHNGPLIPFVERQLFMAYRNGVPAGRLCVHRNTVYNEHYRVNQGFFGYLETLDNPGDTRLILQAGARWLKSRGCSEMLGPMGFSLYDGVGLLTDGYEDAPVVQCPYNPPYYTEHLHQAGFQKAIDWYAYRFHRTHIFPDVVTRIHDRLVKRKNLTFRYNDSRSWSENIEIIRNLFNEAWAGNWGHVPMNKAQWRYLTDQVRPALIDPLCFITFVDGQPAGFIITIKDMNEALQGANGRLLPLGWLRILRASAHIKRIRVLAMGVANAFRNRGYDLLMTSEVVKKAIALGYEVCDCSQVVESNQPLIEGLNMLGGERYKTFRIYRGSTDRMADKLL